MQRLDIEQGIKFNSAIYCMNKKIFHFNVTILNTHLCTAMCLELFLHFDINTKEAEGGWVILSIYKQKYTIGSHQPCARSGTTVLHPINSWGTDVEVLTQIEWAGRGLTALPKDPSVTHLAVRRTFQLQDNPCEH